MALSGEEIDAVVDALVHGAEERYIAELYDTAIDELRRGLEYSATVDLETLARAYPDKAMTILLKYKDEISDEVVVKVEEALRESSAADLTALDAVYGAAATKAAAAAVRGGLTKHFNDMSKQTAEGVKRIIERQNVLLATDMRAVWYKTVTDCVSAVNQGLKPMDKVLADGVEKLINAGISVVPYSAGSRRTVTNQVDVALRRHLTTEMSQAAGRMSLEAMDLYGHDLVITSSHYGARPSHSVWQGLPCCRSGRKTVDGVTYPDLVSFTEYGAVTGLKGANCRHMMFPYFPGISKLPDREFKAERAKFGMSSEQYYEATQRQRVLERRVRGTKRQVAAMERAGLGCENPSYVNKRLLLGKQQKTLKAWCDNNNLVRLPKREKAYGVATQPRALRQKSLYKAKASSRYIYESSQEEIDEILVNELSGVRFSAEVKYSNRIKTPGKTVIIKDENGLKYIKSMQIGRQELPGKKELIDSIVHEELEARIALNQHSSEKYWHLSSCSKEERHAYIQKVIDRFMQLKGI